MDSTINQTSTSGMDAKIPKGILAQKQLDVLVREMRRKLRDTEIPGSIIARTDSPFLSRFLRIKNYNVDKAIKALLKYYNCIHKHRKMHQGIRPSQYPGAFHSECISVLKHRFDGVAVGVGRIKHWDPSELKLLDFQRGAIFIAETFLNMVDLQENGFAIIVDFEGLRFQHLWHATVKEIRRCAEITLKGLPIRLIGVHVLNTPSIFWPVYQVGKHFVKEKIHQRIHFHDSLDSLHKFFDKSKLPISLGGDLSETDAVDNSTIPEILAKDIPYEDYWNGETFQHKFERRLSRKRSSMDIS